jgi:hypothetical protein
MKKLLACVLMVVFSVSAAMAADTVVMKAKNGDVTFNHKAHSATPESCVTCHGEGKPAKVALGKDKAHKLCKDCHVAQKKGPTGCKEWHKK